MIKISRKVVVTWVLLFSLGLSFFDLPVLSLALVIEPLTGEGVRLLHFLLFVGLYQSGQAVYHGPYIPWIYLVPILPEISIVSKKVQKLAEKLYDTVTEELLLVFSHQTKFDKSAIKIVRQRSGFLLKSVFVTLSFAWALLEFYQGMDPSSSSTAIESLLTAVQSLSHLISLNYIVAQLGGLMLAYGSVRAFSLEISHFDEGSRYKFSHRVFGELICGGTLLLLGVLLPALQIGYSLLRSTTGLSNFGASITISLVSLLLITSVWHMIVSILAGFLMLFDLVLIVIFANMIGLQNDLSILVLALLFALFAYSIYRAAVVLLTPLTKRGQRILEKTGIIKI